MITKELKFLELEDNREGIDKIIKEECKGKSIDIYVDYRDCENLESLVLSCDNVDEFCDKIYESYREVIDEEDEKEAHYHYERGLEEFVSYLNDFKELIKMIESKVDKSIIFYDNKTFDRLNEKDNTYVIGVYKKYQNKLVL